jgi:hypothetical protein
MPVYSQSEKLVETLQVLFERIQSAHPGATASLAASRLIIRLACSAPAAEITINGRKQPVQITYGKSPLRPDLDIQLNADALHQILLGELTLSQAVGSGEVKIKGPVWKSFVLEDVLHHGQAIYPGLLE